VKLVLSQHEKLQLEFVANLLNLSPSDCIRLMVSDTHMQFIKDGWDGEMMGRWAQFYRSREGTNDGG